MTGIGDIESEAIAGLDDRRPFVDGGERRLATERLLAIGADLAGTMPFEAWLRQVARRVKLQYPRILKLFHGRANSITRIECAGLGIPWQAAPSGGALLDTSWMFRKRRAGLIKAQSWFAAEGRVIDDLDRPPAAACSPSAMLATAVMTEGGSFLVGVVDPRASYIPPTVDPAAMRGWDMRQYNDVGLYSPPVVQAIVTDFRRIIEREVMSVGLIRHYSQRLRGPIEYAVLRVPVRDRRGRHGVVAIAERLTGVPVQPLD